MKTPSVTPAQLLALVKFAVTYFVAQHYVSPGQSRLVLQVAAVVLPAVLVAADAFLRGKRVHLAFELAAQAYQRELRQGWSAPSEAKAADVDPTVAVKP